jgi:hypothetical protein
MARRRRNNEVNLNFDSLLDTMFNVVGILVLMVVLAQVNVGSAVGQLEEEMEQMEEVSEEELAEVEQRAEQLASELGPLRNKAETAEDNIERYQNRLTRLRGQLSDLDDDDPIDPGLKEEHESAEETLAKLREKKQQLEVRTTEASDQLQKLKARLDDTEPREKKPDRTITLPRPRSAPEGWEPVHVLVANDKLYFYRRDESQDILRQIMEEIPQIEETEDMAAGRSREIFQEQIIEKRAYQRSQKRPWEAFFELEPQIGGRFDRRPEFKFVPREEAGISRERLSQPNPYRRVLRRAAEHQSYLRFYVKPDSFDTYLEARALADQADVPAGWEIRRPGWTYHFRMGADRFELTQSKQKIQEVKEEMAQQDNNDDEDDDEDIPDPKVDRDVGGEVD